jgi:hypothetical protein
VILCPQFNSLLPKGAFMPLMSLFFQVEPCMDWSRMSVDTCSMARLYSHHQGANMCFTEDRLPVARVMKGWSFNSPATSQQLKFCWYFQ